MQENQLYVSPICKSDEFTHSAYDSIINIDSNSELRESRWTLIDVILNHFDNYLTSYREEEFPIQGDAPSSYSVIDIVFANRQDLSQLVWSIYGYMSGSYHQQYLNDILVSGRESIVKTVLQKMQWIW